MGLAVTLILGSKEIAKTDYQGKKKKILSDIICENYLFIFYMWISSSKVKNNDISSLDDVDVTHLPFIVYFKGKRSLLFEKYLPNELIHQPYNRELDRISLLPEK